MTCRCADCGLEMTKEEGGTVFTVCSDCWVKNPKGEIRETCGCVAKTWYGCIHSQLKDCDGKTRYTLGGQAVEFEHSCDYEEQACLDDTGCQFTASQLALQGLASALLVARGRLLMHDSKHDTEAIDAALREEFERDRFGTAGPIGERLGELDDDQIEKTVEAIYDCRVEPLLSENAAIKLALQGLADALRAYMYLVGLVTLDEYKQARAALDAAKPFLSK